MIASSGEHLPHPERVFAELSECWRRGAVTGTVPAESHAGTHAPSTVRDLCALIERAGLAVSSIQTKWHISYGDDRRHIFAVAEAKREVELGAEAPVYSLSLPVPHISSAASSGIVSS